ncbi:MAG: hypothetical protein ACD_10C00302G0003 [uncultured bacterium]|nr:MAG: hypothetical protein ACD_10C00302G0003 [uncultured bacterium]
MKTLILLVLMIFGIAIFIKMKKRNGTRNESSTVKRTTPENPPKTPPYFGKTVLSEPEQILFHRLKEALPNQLVFVQVAMNALVGIRKNPTWQSQFNVISGKYVDFVVCNPDFTVKAIVELDDSTHQRTDRIKSDAVKDLAFQKISCPMVRFHVREIPNIEQIRLAIG